MKVSSALRWFATAICTTLVISTQAANCGVRTGIAQPSDEYEINWHNRLAAEIAQKDAPNVSLLLSHVLFGSQARCARAPKLHAWRRRGQISYFMETPSRSCGAAPPGATLAIWGTASRMSSVSTSAGTAQRFAAQQVSKRLWVGSIAGSAGIMQQRLLSHL